MTPTTSTVASMQHSTPGRFRPRSTTKNTDKYSRLSTSDVQTGGGGCGSQARCNGHSTLTHNKNKNMTPTTSTVGSMQHSTPGQHPPRSTTTNTDKYSKCRTVDVEAGGGGRVAQRRCNRHVNINKIKRPSHPPLARCQHAAFDPGATSTSFHHNKYL